MDNSPYVYNAYGFNRYGFNVYGYYFNGCYTITLDLMLLRR